MKRLYSWQGWAIVDEQDRAMKLNNETGNLQRCSPPYAYELWPYRKVAEAWKNGHKVVRVTITVKVEDE